MRFSVLFVGLILLAVSCKKDSFLTLHSNAATEAFIPNYSSAKNFRSQNGDTIKLYLLESSNYFERSFENLNSGGSSGDLDYMELERTRVVIGNDTLGYRFSYNITTSYNVNSPNKVEDVLKLTFLDQQITADTELELHYIFNDSIKCISQDCSFADTLQIQNIDYKNVYYSPRRNTTNLNALYINSSNGLVGFKTRSNLIFELIP